MAINYTTLFTRLGKVVKNVNLWLAYQTTLATNGSDLLDQFETRRDLVPNEQLNIQGRTVTVAAWEQRIKAISDATLLDLQADLFAINKQLTTILPLLSADMIANAQTVLKCTVGTSAAVGGSNVGNATLVVQATSEAIIADVVKITCTRDQYTGTQPGAERLNAVGSPAQSVFDGVDTRGSGSNPSLIVADANNIVSGGSFDAAFVSGVPAGWIVDTSSGIISQETSLVHTGAGALKMAGDGVQATCTLHQDVQIRADSKYVIGCWLRKAGTVTGGSNLLVELVGTGFTPVILFNADPTTLTTSYVLHKTFLDSGTVIPSDLNVKITWTTMNAAGASAIILVDDVVLSTPYTLANVYYALFRGSVDIEVGDVWTVTNTNDYAGLFQTFFARFYGTTLPSSASPSISDSLAT